jgi:splicing factor 3A subunit 1
MIIPPADLRPLIEKTAEYVAKNGSQLEEIIYNKEKDNPMFSFLKLSDPYRAYYDKRVIELARSLINPLNEDMEANKLIMEYQAKQNQMTKPEQEEEPENLEFKFSYPQPRMNLFEAEMVRLTAFYTAMNGYEFLDRVSQKEADNPFFHFLRPSHRLFHYFTNLVESYIAVRDIGKDQFKQLHENCTSKESILNRCARRIQLEKQEFKEKKRLIEDTNKIKENADYDWNNFVIVETIDLEKSPSNIRDNENQASESDRANMKLHLGRKSINPEFAFLAESLKPEKKQRHNTTYTRDVTENEKIDLNEDRPQLISFTPIIDGDMFYKCSFCGQNIPANIFEEHNRQELKLKEEKIRSKPQGKVFGHIEISENIEKMMEKRSELLNQPSKEAEKPSVPEFRQKSVSKPSFLSRK